MIIIDTLTITVCGVLLLLAVATPFCNVLFRIPRLDTDSGSSCNNEESKVKRPGFSIIISVHDNAMEIERNLPAFLEQKYSGNFEVVVIDESSTDETSDVLKRFKNRYANLYTTFIPASSHYLSRRKLSLTIGVKAAKYEWLIFTGADCRPASDLWLETMSSHCNGDLILGETRYDNDASDYVRLDNVKSWFRQLGAAQKSTAYAYCGRNLAMRRSLFMKNYGFLKNLKYLRGEYDFIANEYSTPYNTETATEEEARIIRDVPTSKGWINDKLFFIETTRHLKRSFSYSLPVMIDNLLLHSTLLLHIAAIALSAVIGMYVITAVAAVSLLISYLLRVLISSRAMKAIAETIPVWKIPLLDGCEIWRNAILKIKHSRSDKDDFIRR